ncbi:hypothetical protein D2V17_10890 [Aurantiacibacter xanthus]|uniref:DUF4398 domain-containing protein n=1 Tax=Aurantiacibacter xanthus TaxID=1784712 RepID=A0A3A1P538_9SPHN|nr:hypothetical protein [Aurantiacibacter xanthus]RIV85245.1 hypothetical protein D2V17_10890 [Aurantiacibacter xanthus]
MTARIAILFVAAGPLALGACATPSGEYPSLAQREIERTGLVMTPPQTIPSPPQSPAAPVLTEASELVDSVRTVHAAFLAGEAAVRSRVAAARGATSGSEAWALAEVALAGLSSQRSRAMVALADLDRLYIAASTSGESTETIGAARSEAASMVAAEDAVLSELTAQLRS